MMTNKEKADQIFRVEGEIKIQAPPEAVFVALTTGLDAWWPFRTKPEARIVYDARPGGYIYEDWGQGNYTLYAQIVQYEPPRSSISIGPGGIGVSAFTSRNIDLVEPDGEGGSLYKKTLLFWGHLSKASIDMYTSGSERLNQILREYLETGKGYTPGA
ncbi:MAG: hypothetical protein KIS85_02170 [Anaerolineales bacterium]|nr:hypothetical protein [Anaerolineales bacterium]